MTSDVQDDPSLRELKVLQQSEGKSLGRLVSDLLAHALKQQGRQKAEVRSFVWDSSPMGARVDLSDTEALYSAMDGDFIECRDPFE